MEESELIGFLLLHASPKIYTSNCLAALPQQQGQQMAGALTLMHGYTKLLRFTATYKNYHQVIHMRDELYKIVRIKTI
jgi:hypothetical protein